MRILVLAVRSSRKIETGNCLFPWKWSIAASSLPSGSKRNRTFSFFLLSQPGWNIRFDVIRLLWNGFEKEDGSYKLRNSDKYKPTPPVYFVLSVESDGLHISCASKNLGFTGIEDNDARYRLLNASNDLNPFKIPVSSLSLFYQLTSRVDDSLFSVGHLSHLPKEALKNLSFGLGPSDGQPGFKGPVIKEVNRFFDIDRDCVETVIIYISLLTDPNSNQGLVAKDPPLKLRFAVIDKAGEEDLVASRELYHVILAIKDPLSAQKIYVSFEELYRNIPSNVIQEEGWKQWENAYEGKFVKEIGRIYAISIHPHKGKLFMIVTLAGKEGSIENKPRQLALLVEDAHDLKLGEQEGTFLLDGIKWIHLGETYAFKGRVSKFSLFDKELRGTDYKDLIIVKTKIKDID